MNRITGYQGMTIAGIFWGVAVFFVFKIFDTSPYWISALGGLAVFFIAFLFRNVYRRSIGTEGDDLVISDGDTVTRVPKDQILSYKIERISSLNLRITMRDQKVVSIPIDGFFSESQIVGILDSLGIGKD
jgi:hypothetical protein